MTDNEVNFTSTTEADYSSYYDDTPQSSPCNNTNDQEFSRVFLPTFYSLVFILGFIGNGLVVCVIVKYRKQANLTDICLCNLALSDLLFVLTLPFYAHYIVVQQWTFGDFMCHVISGSHHAGFFSSTFFMIVMTVERYIIIVLVHKVRRYRTKKLVIIVSVFVWMLSVCVSLPTYIFTTVEEESGKPSCDLLHDEAWGHFNLLTTNVLGLVVPLLVMTVCYSRMLFRLANMKTVKKHRVVKLIISIMVIFVVFWAPYNISLFLDFLLKNKSDCTLYKNLQLSISVTEAIAYAHCCLNPIIYAFVGQKFMIRASKMLKNWIPFYSRTSLDSSFRKSSVSRSSDATSTFVM
ncbi:unnamed protein product [Ophioblennius macclurei]